MNIGNITLAEKRSEVKQFINDGIAKTFPAYLFDYVGKLLQGLFHLSHPPHRTVDVFVWLAIVYVPGLLVAIIFKEMARWDVYLWFYSGMLAIGYFAAVVCYVNVVYNLLPGIRDYIVDSILAVEDLDKLKKWLARFWSLRGWLGFTLVAGLWTAIAFVIGVSYRVGEFIGIGLTVATFSVGPFFIGAVYILIYMLTLPPQVAAYRLKTYGLNPAHSEVVQRLSSIFNIYLYLVAGYVALGTTLSSLNPITSWWVWGALLLGWIPTISQFLVNQYSIRKIIVNAKWIVLNQLQEQIDLQSKNLGTSPEPIAGQINALMDLHDRIRSSPNSMLNLGTGINFLNQLMLPALGLLLGNVDILLNLFKP